jgi:hypothetical protein
MLAGEGEWFRSPDAFDDGDRFFEQGLPRANRGKRQSKLAEFLSVPANPEAKNDTAIADPVKVGSEPGEHDGMSVGDAIDHRTQADTLCRHRHCGEV